jgi:hypothetical protein
VGIEEAILGFDARAPAARERVASGPLSWDSFLLREVSAPLSVDTLVWPSLVEKGDRPQWIGPNADLWEDLEVLRQFVAASSFAKEPHWLVAVTGHSADGFDGWAPRGLHLERTRPPHRNDEWELIGYDVTDGGVSGLMNCGYLVEDKMKLAPVWAPKLNQHHLFTDVRDALAFLPVTEQRVAEHAPFFVFGIWKIPG